MMKEAKRMSEWQRRKKREEDWEDGRESAGEKASAQDADGEELYRDGSVRHECGPKEW